MPALNHSEIKNILPHRYPFMLLDRVLDYEKQVSIKALKNVTQNEEYFNGHFPHRPLMPGVLVIEACAQAGALLSFLSLDDKPNESSDVFFAGIDKARFKRLIVPGDQLILQVTIDRIKNHLWKYHAEAYIDGQLAVEADLMNSVRL